MFYFGLVGCVSLFAISLVLAWFQKYWAVALLCAALAIVAIFGAAVPSLVVAVASVSTLLLAAVWTLMRLALPAPNGRVALFVSFSVLCAATSLLPLADAWRAAQAAVAEYRVAAARHPFVSLVDRLAYETRGEHGPPRPLNTEGLSAESQERLAKLESMPNLNWSRRRDQLQLIHADTVAQFSAAPGFGFSRMPSLGPPQLPKIDRRVLPRNAPKEVESPGDLIDRGDTPAPTAPPNFMRFELTVIDPWDAHAATVAKFANSDTTGFVESLDRVAGFEPHAFRESYGGGSFLDSPTIKVDDVPARLELVRLELVSLLKFEEPAVYVSKSLPAMDELVDAPTRPLTPFEQASLEKMRGGEDLITEQEGASLRMLGSLRATKQCVECHHVKRGELLGAFSYELVASQPPQ